MFKKLLLRLSNYIPCNCVSKCVCRSNFPFDAKLVKFSDPATIRYYFFNWGFVLLVFWGLFGGCEANLLA